jgi:fructose-specific phosphotransferase system IIC component
MLLGVLCCFYGGLLLLVLSNKHKPSNISQHKPIFIIPIFLKGLSFYCGVLFLFVLYQWFGEAIAESESGRNGVNVDISYRWSMSWFILSLFSVVILR